MTPPKMGLSLMPEQDYLDASLPLFESGQVEVIEWSFDMCWGKKIPQRCHDLLEKYSDDNCLLGHGVSFSILTAKRTKRQEIWLQYLQKEMSHLHYQNISEHFGFLTTDTFIQGPPLSMPFIPELVEVGINNLQEIKQIAQIPIGLENLGFAFSRQDVIDQGKFITALLDAVDGFLLLDIHNIYCHMLNFNMSFEEILETLPRHRLKEMHISGGSFRDICYQNKTIYCDSHDAAIPEDLFLLLEKNLPYLLPMESIIFERMGNTFSSPYEVSRFQDDFANLKSIVQKASDEMFK
ncbi:hypothetical protein Lsan_1810 [Legionella santicrucis]|uniref:Xylose isomerase-like TIM barrel n=1 Tax=Legionella santicrucis TaxID=45074 RepID=A0A0W0YZD7_9GAMM|nr:DUF692 family multinuclear iron-containing protein [Legionella santicrucis]KTD62277.1 hypothetical protein Lsan_1810 [Legionella santicrucis]